MRKFRYILSAATLTVSMLIAAPAAATSPTEEQTLERWQPTLVSSEPLFNGSVVRQRYEGGVTAVVPTGARVFFNGEEATKGHSPRNERTITQSVGVVLPLVEATAQDARKYREAGRSVYAEAIAAGFPPRMARQMAGESSSNATAANPPIWDSGCLYMNEDPDYSWSGCYIRYVTEDADPNAYYSTESGKAYGWGTGVLGGGKELIRGYSEHTYTNPNGEIIDADPSSGTRDSSACVDVTLGVSYIVSASVSVPVCPDRWVAIRDTYLHHAEWQGGSAGGPPDTVSAGHITQFRNPEGTFGFYVYSIGATVACFCL